MLSFKSIIAIYFTIICIRSIFHPVHSAAIAPLTKIKAGSWFIHSNSSNSFDLQQEHLSKHDFHTIEAHFNTKRNELLNEEMEMSFGHDITLNENELRANRIIMDAKEIELKNGAQNPLQFNPSRHLFEVLKEVKQSKLFKLIQQMPKGGILHIHETSMVSTDFFVSLTYLPSLWQRGFHHHNFTDGNDSNNTGYEIAEFRFAPVRPSLKRKVFKHQIVNEISPFDTDDENEEANEWRLVSDVRDEMGATIYDQYVRSCFTLHDKNVNPKLKFWDANHVWVEFLKLFNNVWPILAYMPARRAYYRQVLKEFHDDGVQYVEIRAGISEGYDIDGNVYSREEVIKMYADVTEEFKRENPSFIGAKLIFSKPKDVPSADIMKSFEVFHLLHEKFPEFVVGFDLVGQEDTTPALLSYIPEILKLPYEVKLFLHAGETNWYGSVDENLIDAILIGSHRIGHGYALAKHPKLIDLVKRKNIAVEVNPISNQILKLVDDYRNHPASVLLAQNVPVIISSDDPSFWETTPLTHDFYMAFLGIASRRSDLRVLKKFAMNSILYSSLNDIEKQDALIKWQTKWDAFIADIVQNDV